MPPWLAQLDPPDFFYFCISIFSTTKKSVYCPDWLNKTHLENAKCLMLEDSCLIRIYLQICLKSETCFGHPVPGSTRPTWGNAKCFILFWIFLQMSENDAFGPPDKCQMLGSFWIGLACLSGLIYMPVKSREKACFCLTNWLMFQVSGDEYGQRQRLTVKQKTVAAFQKHWHNTICYIWSNTIFNLAKYHGQWTETESESQIKTIAA